MLRSLFLLALIAIPAIYILFNPFVGVMLWTWISSMTPHRLTYGFLYDAPIVYAIALVTLVVIIFRNEIKYLPRHPLVVLVALYVGWVGICTIFALEPRLAFEAWTELLKVTALAFATAVTLRSRKRLYLLLSLLGISFAYYGVKGGLFTVLTGGAFRALGAPGSFMEGTNEYATVMLMSLPLMIWLGRHAEWWLLRWMFRASVPLTVVAILGTQSRGGLVALGVMSLFMAFRHRRLMILLLLLLVAAPIVWETMPANWRARMETISEYSKDASFMGRVTMWKAAARSSSDHPIFGVGADGWRDPDFQAKYVPLGEQPREWHSIYFGNLGEYGYPGLFLFVCILFMAIFSCRSVARVTEGRSELTWARELALAMQASYVGFAAVGLVMHFPMFDLYFQLIAITAVVVKMVEAVLAFERDRSPLMAGGPAQSVAEAEAEDRPSESGAPAGPAPAWAHFAMAGAPADARWRHVHRIDPKYERWRQRQGRLGGFGPRWEPPPVEESDA